MTGLTHKQLCDIGKSWLINAKGCNPVFVERGSARLREIPDVIGWDGNTCYVIECKISMSDYLADYKKPHRYENGLGEYRYYLVAREVFEKVEKPENGWGLVLATENDINTYARQASKCDSRSFPRNLTGEIAYMRSRFMEIQRYGK